MRRGEGASLLAIDADPNSCFADALGVKSAPTIVGTCEEISGQMSKIPAGMTKERFIEMRVQESLAEEKAFDMLVMGRPEGPGCYCYVNNLLRNIIDKITRAYDYVVIDNAAGMEHISRRTMRGMNKLVLVSDYSVPGIRSAKKIYELAKELGIKIPEGEYDTLSGFVFSLLGKLPIVGDEVKYDDIAISVERIHKRRIIKVKIVKTPKIEKEDAVGG